MPNRSTQPRNPSKDQDLILTKHLIKILCETQIKSIYTLKLPLYLKQQYICIWEKKTNWIVKLVSKCYIDVDWKIRVRKALNKKNNFSKCYISMSNSYLQNIYKSINRYSKGSANIAHNYTYRTQAKFKCIHIHITLNTYRLYNWQCRKFGSFPCCFYLFSHKECLTVGVFWVGYDSEGVFTLFIIICWDDYT